MKPSSDVGGTWKLKKTIKQCVEKGTSKDCLGVPFLHT